MSRFKPVFTDQPLDGKVSVTLLMQENSCSRAGFLYHAYKGLQHTGPMERGSAIHRALELAVRECIDQGEASVPPDVAKAVLAEVIADPEYRMAIEEHDFAREAVYRWAREFTCDPQQVVGVEQMMVLDCGDGWVVRGRVDYAELLEGGAAVRVCDWKSSRAMPGQEDVGRTRPDGSIAAKDVQLVLYALMCVFGRPMFEDDSIGPLPLAGMAQRVDLSLVFPGIETKDGLMATRDVSLTRLELEEYLQSVRAQVHRIAVAEQTGDWPATSGSHCSICPCPSECPIPAEVRDFAGSINSPEQAAVVAEKQERARAIWDAVDKELKTFVKKAMGGGPLRFGRDRVLEVQYREAEKPRRRDSREAMFEAIERAVEFGEPFDRGEFYRTAMETRLVARSLSELELEEELVDAGSGQNQGTEAGHA